jgi:hypothetical protein
MCGPPGPVNSPRLWLGGSGAYGQLSRITTGKERSFAAMVASLVYYARVVKGLNFTYLRPLNEEDWDCKEVGVHP